MTVHSKNSNSDANIMEKTIVFYVVLMILTGSEGEKEHGLTSLEKCNEYYKLLFLPDSNVYGGVRAPPNHLGVEFMAALGYTNENKKVFFCGGTLISENFVLTAAQCVMTWYKVEFIRLGDLNLASSADDFDVQEFQLAEYFVHPSHNPPYPYHDIALIKLDKPAVFTSFVFPACLLPKQVDISNKDLYIAGWGYYGEVEDDHILQVARVQYYNMTKCLMFYPRGPYIPESIKPESQICALGQDNMATACQGDSGGPMVYKYNISPQRVVYYVAGIISYGAACGVGIPDVYTRVSHYSGWIENIVWPNNN